MKELTLDRIAKACGGSLKGAAADPEKCVTAITSDSRKVEKGGLFVAIPGARVDGHDFIPQVMEAGAYSVLSEKDLGQVDFPYVQVTSSLEAVQKIAREYLHILGIPVVGIAGSVGKTSTKEMTAAVLSQKYSILKTEGNFNNNLGLPLTVFRLREEKLAVLEMGISDFGEMHELSEIAEPHTCIMTNIGCCHLENLIDRDGILRAKSEIFDFMKADGHVILNGDDDKLVTIKEVKGIKPIFYGLGKDNHVWAENLESQGLKGTSCTIHTPEASFQAFVPAPGEHMVYNALAATAAGLCYGLTLEEIRKGIASYLPVSGRFRILDTGHHTLIDDCYNANPVSMKASLSSLTYGLGRRVAILGDMGELGENEKELHYGVGVHAGEQDIQAVYCVGPLCENLAKGAKDTNKNLDVKHYPDLESLLGVLPELLQEGDTILVKASHYMEFPKLVEAVCTLDA